MKLIKLSFALLLALAIGGSIPAMAQHDRDDDHHGRDRDDDRGPGKHGKGHAYGHYKHDDWDDHHREGHYTRYVVRENHRYIPEDHFRAHFGREHRFVVRTVVVEGRPRFQYDGYWFVAARPMPWRAEEPVFVDYVDDHYYVCSPAHPGIRISINIL